MNIGQSTFYKLETSDRVLFGTVEDIDGDRVTIRNEHDKRQLDVVWADMVGDQVNKPFRP